MNQLTDKNKSESLMNKLKGIIRGGSSSNKLYDINGEEVGEITNGKVIIENRTTTKLDINNI